MTDNKKIYQDYVKNNHVSVFQELWWLDATIGANNWEVLISYNGDCISGFWPICWTNRFGFKKITVPKLTKIVSPIILYPKDLDKRKYVGFQNEVLTNLINELPKFDQFDQYFHPNINNVLAFIWNGFRTQLRYSYQLNDLSNLNKVYNGFKSSLKRQIKKADSVFTILASDSVDDVYRLNEETFGRQSQAVPFSRSYLLGLHQACKKHKACTVLVARNKNSEVIATLYLVEDSNWMYYLLGGTDLNYRNSGVAALLLWEGIQLASEKGLGFDFVGSMIPSIERFVRSFGGVQTSSISIHKTNSRFLRIINSFR